MNLGGRFSLDGMGVQGALVVALSLERVAPERRDWWVWLDSSQRPRDYVASSTKNQQQTTTHDSRLS